MQIKPGRTTSTRVFSSWSRVGALTAFVGTRFPQISNAFSRFFGGVLRANGASSLQDGRTQAWCQSDCFAKAPLPLYTVPPVNVHRRFSFSLLLCDLSVAHSTCSYIEPVAQCKNRSDYSFSECFYRFTGETRQRSGRPDGSSFVLGGPDPELWIIYYRLNCHPGTLALISSLLTFFFSLYNN